MVRINRSYRIQVCSTKMCPKWRAPLGFSTDRLTGTDQTPRYAKSLSRSSSSLRVLRRQGAAKHKPARRQAAKLCYRFGPLTPSARSANLIAGDGTKNDFPAPNKEPANKPKDHLTGNAPYRFESGSLQRRVRFISEPLPPTSGASTACCGRARRCRPNPSRRPKDLPAPRVTRPFGSGGEIGRAVRSTSPWRCFG